MHMKEGTIIQAIGINDWENQTGGISQIFRMRIVL